MQRFTVKCLIIKALARRYDVHEENFHNSIVAIPMVQSAKNLIFLLAILKWEGTWYTQALIQQH